MKKLLGLLVLGLLFIFASNSPEAKAEFVSINCPENHETSLTYKPQRKDEPRLDGKNNKKK